VHPSSRRLAAQPVLSRTLAAALVGLALPFLAWAITLAGLSVLPYDGLGGAGGWGRIGQGMIITAGAVPFLLVVSWPLLWALRVRPAWHVALSAPIVALVFGFVLNTTAARIIANPVVAVAVVLALAYGLTAAT